jgi:hypothetical protein
MGGVTIAEGRRRVKHSFGSPERAIAHSRALRHQPARLFEPTREFDKGPQIFATLKTANQAGNLQLYFGHRLDSKYRITELHILTCSSSAQPSKVTLPGPLLARAGFPLPQAASAQSSPLSHNFGNIDNNLTAHATTPNQPTSLTNSSALFT